MTLESRQAETAPSGPWTERGSVRVPTGTLAYATLGEGTPVILLHKVGGWIADWNAFAQHVPSGYRLVAIDLTGHGDSKHRPPASWEFPLEDGAADVVTALDALHIDRAAFVGNSLGGNYAMIVAANDPNRVSTLVLSSAAMPVGMTRQAAEQVDRDHDADFDAQDVPTIRPYAKVAHFYAEHRPDLNDELNCSRQHAGPWVRWCERAVFLYPSAALLPRIAVPTAVLFGDHDPYIDLFAATARSIPNVEILTISMTSRFPHQERPEATAELVTTFLSSRGDGPVVDSTGRGS